MLELMLCRSLCYIFDHRRILLNIGLTAMSYFIVHTKDQLKAQRTKIHMSESTHLNSLVCHLQMACWLGRRQSTRQGSCFWLATREPPQSNRPGRREASRGN